MLLLALLVAAPALGSEPPPPACGQPRVLEAVEARLSRAGQRVAVEPGSAGQVPGLRRDVVYCAVRVRTAVYDTPRFGPRPAELVEEYRYALELRRNGVFLLP